MADSISITPEQQFLADWNRARGQARRENQRRPAWREYGPRTFRQASLPALNSALRSEPNEAYDDQGSEDLQAQRFGQQTAPRQRLAQSWQAARQGTGPQADAVVQRAQRYAQLRAQRRERQGLKTGEGQIEAEAQMFIRQAYARVWDGVQEAIADFALAFWGILSLITFPVQGTVFFARLLSGIWGDIQWRGVSVRRVPPYSWITGCLHAGRLLINAILFIIWAAVLFGAFYLIANIVTNPILKAVT